MFKEFMNSDISSDNFITKERSPDSKLKQILLVSKAVLRGRLLLSATEKNIRSSQVTVDVFKGGTASALF